MKPMYSPVFFLCLCLHVMQVVTEILQSHASAFVRARKRWHYHTKKKKKPRAALEEFGSVSLVMKYYKKLATKSEIQTHPERKNMAASACSLFSWQTRVDATSRPGLILLQREGCGQCCEALLMGWLVLLSLLCGWSLFLWAWDAENLWRYAESLFLSGV